jgi:hypothetical protein
MARIETCFLSLISWPPPPPEAEQIPEGKELTLFDMEKKQTKKQ